MSNSLLSTMAILLANYDVDRDYFSNFEPFVLDCLREWPERRPVKPMELRTEIAGRFSLPDIPINTVTMLRERAARGGYLRRRGQEFYPLPSKLQSVAEIAPERTETLAHFNALRLCRSFSWIWRTIVAVGVVVGIIGGIYQVAAEKSDPAPGSKASER
jgi:hypothetical protein